MNGYDLSRQWFAFAFENSACKLQHTALYTWIIELNNRLGWKKQFGLPTTATMELGFTNRNTFINTLKDLENWGFIRIVQEARNQNQARIIEVCPIRYDKAAGKPLDKALQQHCNAFVYGQESADDTINKPSKPEITNTSPYSGDTPGGSPVNRVSTAFKKPSEAEIAAYFSEITGITGLQATLFSGQFWNYYESKGWRVGREPMKNWKASVRTWLAKDPERYRTNEGPFEYKTVMIDGNEVKIPKKRPLIV